MQRLHYIVNRQSPNSGKGIVEKNTGNRWEWEEIAQSSYTVNENILEIEINRKSLNIKNKNIDFEFKGNDNMQDNGNIIDFYINGDTASGERFSLYIPKKRGTLFNESLTTFSKNSNLQSHDLNVF